MTLAIIHNWFSSCGALTVPGELNGVSAVAQAEGDIQGQEKRLKQARILGENVLQVAAKLGSEPGASPNGGPTMRFGNSGASGGPPSVS